METLTVLLGLFMIYTLIHGTIIVAERVENVKPYEKFVLWFAFATVTLEMVAIILV